MNQEFLRRLVRLARVEFQHGVGGLEPVDDDLLVLPRVGNLFRVALLRLVLVAVLILVGRNLDEQALQPYLSDVPWRGHHQIAVRPGNLEALYRQQWRHVCAPVLTHDNSAAAQGDTREQPAINRVDGDVTLKLFAEIDFDLFFQSGGADRMPNPPTRCGDDEDHDGDDPWRNAASTRRVLMHIGHARLI